MPDSGEALRARLRYRSELIDGEIVNKVSPKYKHSIGQLRGSPKFDYTTSAIPLLRSE